MTNTKRITATFYRSRAGIAIIRFVYIAKGNKNETVHNQPQKNIKTAAKNLERANKDGYNVIMNIDIEAAFAPLTESEIKVLKGI